MYVCIYICVYVYGCQAKGVSTASIPMPFLFPSWILHLEARCLMQ